MLVRGPFVGVHTPAYVRSEFELEVKGHTWSTNTSITKLIYEEDALFLVGSHSHSGFLGVGGVFRHC